MPGEKVDTTLPAQRKLWWLVQWDVQILESQGEDCEQDSALQQSVPS